jgi:uncharacterized protein YndB with AHSA1/START domain
MKKEALRVSTTIPAAPTTLYLAWLSSERHSAMTGAAANIDPNVGSKFTACNGYISGKLVILDLGRRIVMSWRTTDFPREAPDSRVEVHMEAIGGSTRLTVLHTEIPEGQGEQYRAVWNDKYFTPMRTFFSSYLPDPRKPPPPRRPPPSEEELAEEEEAAEEEEEEEEEAVEAEEEAPKRVGKSVKLPLSSKKLVTTATAAPKGTASAKAPSAKAPPEKVASKPALKKPAAKAPAKKTAAKKATSKPVKKKTKSQK